ncbi:hypothetical protein F0U44_04925 [Nocardioides humilatus]|uniref:Lactococcin 972 family bacteriocin n=1 Tax=Nocardioides humilatus TaxID=2607660 RepID=A0A5B1LLP0_9ACTN|nr:hypothetical protein [Nocardioides humilatus]KAA1421622.1 hypothetical protein F0U44_04925 [Nocardioides humilatus]
MNTILRRLLAGLALSLAVFGTAQVAAPSSASAASYVTGCFKHTNGSAFHYTINLNYWNNGRWNRVASQEGNYSGCVAWNIAGWLQNYPVKMSVAYRVGTAYFSGESPYYAYAGSARANLGTGWVYQY